MKKLRIKVGRWLAEFAFPRVCARLYLQMRTVLTGRHQSFMAVLSMGEEMHAYSATQGVKALNRKVLLITDTPQIAEMAYADGIVLLNPNTQPDDVVRELESFKLDGVLVSTDHDLLPMQHRIATQFGLISVGPQAGELSNDKLAWRDALASADVPQPAYSKTSSLFDGKDCIRKPRMGWGSQGVMVLSAEDDKAAFGGPEFYFEAVLPGDQYNYEGIVSNGQIDILARMFEKYVEYNGTLVSHYYFFNPPIQSDRDAALEKCTRETLKASGIVNGAYHIEMRMEGELALPIDFANRIGAAERAVSFSIGGNLGQAHANCFLAESNQIQFGKPRAMLQFWCWTEEEFDCAQQLAEANPEWVFETRLTPHKMNGEMCLGMIAIYHDDVDTLLEMAKSLGVEM